MAKLVTGTQLRAARALVGLTQWELAHDSGLHVNSIRYMERKDRIRSAWSVIERVETVLERYGVVLISLPTPGVRLSKDHRLCV